MSSKIEFVVSEHPEELKGLKAAWRSVLSAPEDGMWEAFRSMSTHWEFSLEGERIGYACIDGADRLLQFFLLPEHMDRGEECFSAFIKERGLTTAMVGTHNPPFLSLALRFQKSVKVDTYLFEHHAGKIATPAALPAICEAGGITGTFRVSTQEDLPALVRFCEVSTGAPAGWLNSYLGNLIIRGESYLFSVNGQIAGTCEVRKSDSNPEVVDIGMIVSPDFRRKGLGTFLLGKAAELGQALGRKPICSTEVSNIGSLKAIHSNGFRSIYQILEVSF